jgi:hypothetical protein
MTTQIAKNPTLVPETIDIARVKSSNDRQPQGRPAKAAVLLSVIVCIGGYVGALLIFWWKMRIRK